MFRLALCFFIAASAFAQVPTPEQTVANGAGIGDLLVAPTRVILMPRKRTAELALINIGSAPATYRVSLVHMQMLANGDLKEVESAPGEQYADDFLRFAPRQVTLDPHVVQTVRIQLRLPAELAAGEYRTHMLFRGVPRPETATAPTTTDTGFSVRLTPIYGVSIPVIVRSGDTSAQVSISDVQLTGGKLHLTLNRSGNRSVYGNITVRFTPAGAREREVVVAIMNGVAVYTPLSARTVDVPLQPPSGAALAHGTLRVTYTNAEDNASAVLADARLELP